MKSRVGIGGLVAIGLVLVVLESEGWADGMPSSQAYGYQGQCCVPNVRNYGYYPTQWRRWATEARRDENFPQSVGREQVPTPLGTPTEPMRIERIPSRPIPGLGELPLPADILPADILPPAGPFQPEMPLIPQEPAIPGGIPPFVPSTIPGGKPERGGRGLPTPAPVERPSVPEPPRGSSNRDEGLGSQVSSRAPVESNARPVASERVAPLRQPEPWMGDPQPRFDAIHHQTPAGDDLATRPAGHVSSATAHAGANAKREAASENLATATFIDSQPADDLPLALEGFCPVTLGSREEWRQGGREYMVAYRNQVFYMAGPEERRQFLANPHRFAPMFGGVDPVLVVDEQRWTPGTIQFSATYKGRIYMLSSETNLKRFHENPRRYAFELEE